MRTNSGLLHEEAEAGGEDEVDLGPALDRGCDGGASVDPDHPLGEGAVRTPRGRWRPSTGSGAARSTGGCRRPRRCRSARCRRSPCSAKQPLGLDQDRRSRRRGRSATLIGHPAQAYAADLPHASGESRYVAGHGHPRRPVHRGHRPPPGRRALDPHRPHRRPVLGRGARRRCRSPSSPTSCVIVHCPPDGRPTARSRSSTPATASRSPATCSRSRSSPASSTTASCGPSSTFDDYGTVEAHCRRRPRARRRSCRTRCCRPSRLTVPAFAAAVSEHPLATHATGEVVGRRPRAARRAARPRRALRHRPPRRACSRTSPPPCARLLRPGCLVGATAVVGARRARGGRGAPRASRSGPAPPAPSSAHHVEVVDGADGPTADRRRRRRPRGRGHGPAPRRPRQRSRSTPSSTRSAGGHPDLTVVGGLASRRVPARAPTGSCSTARSTTAAAVLVLLGPRRARRGRREPGLRPGRAALHRHPRRAEHAHRARRPPGPRSGRRRRSPASTRPSGPPRPTGLHMGRVVDEHKLDFDRGDFLVRNVLGVDRDNGAVAVGRRGRGRGHRAVPRARRRRRPTPTCALLLDGHDGDGALVFTCNGRGMQPVRRARTTTPRWSPSPSARTAVGGHVLRRRDRPGRRSRPSSTASPRVDRDRRSPPRSARRSASSLRFPNGDRPELEPAPSTSSVAWPWTCPRRPTPATRAPRWRSPRSPTRSGPASCGTTRRRRDWPNRDRFVLSAGHASILLYSMLHLTGLRPHPRRPRGLPPVGLADPGPPRGPPHRRASRSPPVRSARASPTPSGMALAEHCLRARFGAAAVRPPHLRDLRRRRPRGGRQPRGRLARRPPRPRQARRDLRRQPHHDRRPDRAGALRRRRRSASRPTAGTSRTSARSPTTSTPSRPPSAGPWTSTTGRR